MICCNRPRFNSLCSSYSTSNFRCFIISINISIIRCCFRRFAFINMIKNFDKLASFVFSISFAWIFSTFFITFYVKIKVTIYINLININSNTIFIIFIVIIFFVISIFIFSRNVRVRVIRVTSADIT